MSVISATVGRPAALATSTMPSARVARHRLGVAKGAAATLHVHGEAVESGRELLAKIELTSSGIDSTQPLTSRTA